MCRLLNRVALAALLVVSALVPAMAGPDKPHRVVLQVDSADLAVMNLALNNATNIITYYRDKNEQVEIDLVAYGPGLNMLRADKSSVKDRIAHIADFGYPSKIQFSACNNTKKAMEKKEGHPIALLPQATLVPSGVVQVMQRQEQGWSYVRP